jgi:transposase
MGKKKSRYTKEFRTEAVKLVTEQGYTQAEAAKSLGISSKNLSRWLVNSKNSSISPKNKIKLTAEQEELGQLRKEVKRLKIEREILKKAAAFFANESN